MRLALVSCVKRKASGPRPAKDLYVSPLFRALRTYAETSSDTWYILSAEHGLLHPETVVAPYERTLMRMRQGPTGLGRASRGGTPTDTTLRR
jgi:hypothetical protein